MTLGHPNILPSPAEETGSPGVCSSIAKYHRAKTNGDPLQVPIPSDIAGLLVIQASAASLVKEMKM